MIVWRRAYKATLERWATVAFASLGGAAGSFIATGGTNEVGVAGTIGGALGGAIGALVGGLLNDLIESSED